jgi:uncharacterized protein (DUF2147 family)
VRSYKYILLMLMLIITFACSSCKKDAGTMSSTNSYSSNEFEKLLGKWQRPDGVYTIDIRSIDPNSGKIDAAYFNPNPINVGHAQLRQESGNLNLFLELRDTGYPGCTYKLTYDRQSDQLKGVYYQAAVQESYDIYFTRLVQEN